MKNLLRQKKRWGVVQLIDRPVGMELRQPLIDGMSLDQLLEMFERLARDGDPLSVHLPEVWEWQYFLAVDRFLEQGKDRLPMEQLEQVRQATNFGAYQQWKADPEQVRRDIDEIRREFLAEFGPGA